MRTSKATHPHDPSRIPSARRGALPDFVEPELCTLVKEAPEGDTWIHETKYDGYRILCRIRSGRARLFTRNAKDWTARFPSVAEAAEALPVAAAWIDGELVMEGKGGRSDFQALQNSMSGDGQKGIAYHVFDLLFLDGFDLRDSPLLARKRALAAVLGRCAADLVEKSPDSVPARIHLAAHTRGRGGYALSAACRRGLEGIVSKSADSPYRSGRGADWRKVRCGERQEFVIAGYVPHSVDAQGIGALVLGYFERGELRTAGRVGTGFDRAARRDLKRRLDRVARETPPFADGAPRRGPERWAHPVLVGEVAFTEWTRDGKLRHPSFVGLREDKPASEVRRERT